MTTREKTENTETVIVLPDNLIGLEDQESLESFGGHQISHGRATRFHWDEDENEDPVFEIYRGGKNEELVTRIHRNREDDEFEALDPEGKTLVKGSLDHVMAVLEKKFRKLHNEPPLPA